MKKMVLLILAGVVLTGFIFVASMMWYKFFYDDASTVNSVANLNVQLDSNNNTIDEKFLIPLDEETAKTLTPYTFNVKNNSDKASTYTVLIEDGVISDDANYANKSLLSRDQLAYQLVLNGQTIKVGMLNEIENNVLDVRNIAASRSNNYELRVYVSESAQNTDWQNKYYHFEIVIKAKEDIL